MSLPLVVASSQLHATLLQTQELGQSLADAGLCLVDLRSPEAYEAEHIADAINVSSALLNRSEPPMGGLLPDAHTVNRFLELIGACDGDQIIAYDGGVETAAARLVWVLNAYGYAAASWLDGGFKGWLADRLPTSTVVPVANKGNLQLNLTGDNVISVDDVIAELDHPDVRILDVRSADEYNGVDVRATFGGHVPGASHVLWTDFLDEQGRLLDDETLIAMLKELSVNRDDKVIVYCQTHQRSAVNYVALKHLGFNDVRAIDGAWSAWGNRADTPKQ